MLIRDGLFGQIDLEELAIRRLQEFEPADGYYFANSFGKDSGVVRHLMKKAGVLETNRQAATGVALRQGPVV